LTLDRFNAAPPAEAAALLDGTYEHSPWIVERVLALALLYYRPHMTLPTSRQPAGSSRARQSLHDAPSTATHKFRYVRAAPHRHRLCRSSSQ